MSVAGILFTASLLMLKFSVRSYSVQQKCDISYPLYTLPEMYPSKIVVCFIFIWDTRRK